MIYSRHTANAFGQALNDLNRVILTQFELQSVANCKDFQVIVNTIKNGRFPLFIVLVTEWEKAITARVLLGTIFSTGRLANVNQHKSSKPTVLDRLKSILGSRQKPIQLAELIPIYPGQFAACVYTA